SLRQAFSGVSSISINPEGKAHFPLPGSCPLLTRRTSPFLFLTKAAELGKGFS
ncbi:unnamed protein product, partial [marine sediment metagenome]